MQRHFSIIPKRVLTRVALALCLLLATGCQDELRTKRLGRVSQIGENLSAPATYAVDEFNLAYTTCLALRAKNSALRGEYIGSVFHFELEHTGCTGERAVTSIKTTLSTSGSEAPLLLNGGPQGGYFNHITTHSYGQLAPICRAILEGQTTSNTYQNGEENVQVRFLTAEVPKVYVYTAKNGAVIREDQYVFQLATTAGSTIQGLEQEHKQLIACPNGAYEILRQLFLHNAPY